MKFKKDVIDSHIHLFSWFDEDGEQTLFEAFDDYQERFGMKALNICALPAFKSGDVSNNILSILYKLHNPTAYAYGGLVYPELPVNPPLPENMDAATQYDELMEIGFDGIKLMETKPMEYKMIELPFTDIFYDEFFKKAEKDGTHFIWHVADPETFWDINRAPEWAIREGWYYGDGSYPSNTDIYKQVFKILEKYPKLNVTFAHFFFLADHPDILEKIFDKFENVSIDLVPGSEMYNGINNNYELYQEFFRKYSNRILYGTDVSFPIVLENWDYLATGVYDAVTTDKEKEIYSVEFRGLNLPDDVCEKILCDNFLEKCHRKPTPVNVPALKRYIEKYGHLIEDEKTKALILDYVLNL